MSWSCSPFEGGGDCILTEKNTKRTRQTDVTPESKTSSRDLPNIYIFSACVIIFENCNKLQAKVGNVLDDLFAHDIQLRDGVTAEIMTCFTNLD